MQEDKKVQGNFTGFPFELFVGRSGSQIDLHQVDPEIVPVADPNDKLKNVTPKAPVKLELPFEEFKSEKK